MTTTSTSIGVLWQDRAIDKANRLIHDCSEDTDVHAWEPVCYFVPTPEYAELFVEHPDSWNYDEIAQAMRDYAAEQDRKTGIFYDPVPDDDGYASLDFLREEATEDVIDYVLNLNLTGNEALSVGIAIARNRNATSAQLIRLWDIFNEQGRGSKRSITSYKWRVVSRDNATTELLAHAINTETDPWLLTKMMEMPSVSEAARVQAALKISNEASSFTS